MADWDVGNPGDSDIVSIYPANERAQRSAQRTIFGVDHEQAAANPNQGFHTAIHIIGQANPTPFPDGGILFTQELEGTMELFYMDEDGNIIRFTDGGQSFVGRVRVVIPDTVTTHQAADSDNGNIIVFDTASDCTLTMPQQSTVELTAGYHVLVKNVGGGNVRVVTQGSDTLDDISLLQEPERAVTILLEDDSGPNEWSMIGNQWIPLFVYDDSLSEPPGTDPDVGVVYIVLNGGASWAGHDNEFAIHVGGGDYEFLPQPFDAAVTGWVYRKVVAGIAELFYIDSAGNRVRITRQGALSNPDIVRLPATSAPSGEGGIGKVYSRVIGGITQLFYKGSDGVERQLSFETDLVNVGDFLLPNQVLASTGNQRLPGAGVSKGDGLQIQWGSGTVAAFTPNQAVQFLTQFDNACLQFYVSGETQQGLQAIGKGTTQATTTHGYVTNADDTTQGFSWLAIGY